MNSSKRKRKEKRSTSTTRMSASASTLKRAPRVAPKKVVEKEVVEVKKNVGEAGSSVPASIPKIIYKAARKMPLRLPEPPEESPKIKKAKSSKTMEKLNGLVNGNHVPSTSSSSSSKDLPKPKITSSSGTGSSGKLKIVNGNATPKSLKADNFIRRRNFNNREITPPRSLQSPKRSSENGVHSNNNSNSKSNGIIKRQNGLMKTPKSNRNGFTPATTSQHETPKRPVSIETPETSPYRTPKRPPPPLLETQRTSRRSGRKIFRRRTWPWEKDNSKPNENSTRRGVKRKLIETETIADETDAEEKKKAKGPEDFFMGSTIQYLFHDSNQWNSIPTMSRYSGWDDSKKESAIRALSIIKAELSKNPPNPNQPKNNLDDPTKYRITGKRVTEEKGIEYQVEWGNAEESEDNHNQSEWCLYFEDYNPAEYFQKKRRSKRRAALFSPPTPPTPLQLPINGKVAVAISPATVEKVVKLRSSPRIQNKRKSEGRDANNNNPVTVK